MDNLAQAQQAPTAQGNDTISVGGPIQRKPGGFGRRLLAVFLDGFIMGMILTPITIGLALAMKGFYPAPGSGAQADPTMTLIHLGISYLAQFVAIYFYYGWFYSNKGATPGKMVLGLKVIDTSAGRNVSYWRAFFRETVGKGVSGLTLMIGFLMAAFRKDGKALHDIMFGTQVLHEPKK